MPFDGRALKKGRSRNWFAATIIACLWTFFGLSIFALVTLALSAIVPPDYFRTTFVLIYSPLILSAAGYIHRSWRVPVMIVLVSLPVFVTLILIAGAFASGLTHFR